MRVSWFSAGVSSFVAALLSKPDKIIYIDIDDQHPDSMRFVKDCEKHLEREIEILKSSYGSVDNVCRTFSFIASAYGAKCTDVLKKRVRKEWERQQTEPLTYIWGMDVNESHRATNIIEANPRAEHEFPLIKYRLNKSDAHGLCAECKVKRPIMYDMGYSNNNCIGCVKGGKGYWNKIRVDFPEVFASRAKLERDIGHSCIKGTFLDELDPNAGRMSEEIMDDCSIFCELAKPLI